MYGQGLREGFLVHLYLVRIVDDDVELSESSIVDHERCRLLRAVVDVTMSVHVGDGLTVTRVPQQLDGVCADGLVQVDVSFASRRGPCIAEPPEARDDGIVLNDLIHVRHLETVVHIPSQQRRGEQDLIASITTEIVACQTDVLEHGMHLGKVFAQCFRYAKVTLDQPEHGSGTHAAQDLLRRHRPSRVTSSRKCSIQTL